jgi:DNA-binding cell septation regulator SpoVG
MEISDIKIWKAKHDKVAANGQVVLGGKLRVKFTVFRGQKGLFVGFPGKYGDKVNPETGKKPFYPDVKVVDEEFGKELTSTLLKAYNDSVGGMSQGEAAGPTNQSKAPF